MPKVGREGLPFTLPRHARYPRPVNFLPADGNQIYIDLR